MRNYYKILPLSLCFWVFVLLLTSCGGVEQQASRVCRTLLQRQLYAEIQMDKVSQALLAHDVDSLWVLTQQNDGILYYVFGQDGLLYWSDNWLSADYVELFAYDKWQYVRFDNAHAVCRWKDVGAVNLLVVIPIKYAYPVENAELRNRFVAPFRADDDLELSRLRKRDGRDVCSSDGTFLFSLDYKEGGDTRIREGESLAESFSYQRLLTSEDKSKSAVQHARVRLYFWLMLTIFLIFLVIGIVGLLRHHGFRNMPLSTRFQYCIVALLMASFLAIFMIATVYVQRSYVQRQQSSQEEKCRYIQSSLKELYFWDISLSPHNTAGLNEDLRYLSFIYQTDIHVYDMRGNMIGTSTPVLFDKGLVSRHMSPEPYFKQTPTITRNERIGDLNYLSAYTEFMNGSDVQIGYIAVPLFLSHDKVVGEVDSYIALLLPPYLIALLLALFVSFVMARGLTSSFQHIAERMSSFRIGGRNNHIEYAYNDEVGELVGRYNEMVDQLELSAERLARSEREGAWRTMARQIAHEINNPLTPMRLTIQQLQRLKGTERFDEYFSRSTGVLVSEIDRLSRIASSFSTFAKMPEVHVSEVDVAARLEASIALFRNNDAGVPIRYIGPDSGVMALADEEQIAQVFTNIVKNALQALENQQDGDIIVILKEDETLPNTDIPAVEISFSDNGPGIPDDFREKIFVPNFTTKSTGSGLGLAISKNIVEGCDGKICFETCEKGTNFFVYLRKKQ